MATVSTVLLPENATFDPDIAGPQFRRINGTNFSRVVLAFDAGTKETCTWQLEAIRYALVSGTGNLTLRVYWSASSATSGDVIWGCQLAAVTPDSDSGALSGKAFATAQTVTDTHLGTNAQRLMQAVITISNLDSMANLDHLFLSFYRDAAAGGDTMTGDAFLEALIVEWSDT